MNMNRYIFIILSGILIAACQNQQEHSHPEEAHHHATHEASDANHYMNQMGFDELVERFESPERLAWQRPDTVLSFLEQYAGGITGKRIADIGSGTGFFSFRLAEYADKVIAVDIDQRFLDYIVQQRDYMSENAQNRVMTRLAAEDDPKLEDDEVDLVLIVNTYHHINDRVEYLRKLRNKTERVVIIDFNKEELPVGPPVDMKLDASQVLDEMEEAGFGRARIDPSLLPYQYVVIGQTNI